MNVNKLVEPANKRSPTRSTIPLPELDENQDQDQHLFFSLFPKVAVPSSLGLEPSGSFVLEDKSPIDLVSEVLHSLASTSDSRPSPYEIIDPDTLLKARLSRAELRGTNWLRPDYSGSSKRTVAGWSVDFTESNEYLKVGLVENYIRKKWGKYALRVWKAIDEKSKVDEKAVSLTYIRL